MAHPIVERCDGRRRQQCDGIVLGQRPELQLRQRGQLVARILVGFREQQDDGLGVQPARDEGEHVRSRVIEPVCVVDHTDERPPRGGV
jgi:hypothetical protein